MKQFDEATVQSVQKEDVPKLQFPEAEVLIDQQARSQRKSLLEQSVVLGNTYKGKAKIRFEDDQGVKQIETHIWGLTDSRVILKQGIVIPINRIHEVKL